MSQEDIKTLTHLLSLIDTKYAESDCNGYSAPSKRELKPHDSDVSAVTMDSDGFPAMLRSPKKPKQDLPFASAEVPEQIVEVEEAHDLIERLCMKRPSTCYSMKKLVHKKPACASLLCPGFPRKIETPKGVLKLTFAAGQSYIHFQDLKLATTFLVSRASKSNPNHHDQILNLAQKLSKLKHETGPEMKEAALKMKAW
jgi:hypothetical protein